MTKPKNEVGVYGSIAFLRLTRGFAALIDSADVELIAPYKWRAEVRPHSNTVYAVAKVPGTKRHVKMHRLILGLTNPEIKGEHANNCGIDNRRNNIRVATQRQNQHNRGKQRNNKTGFLGVDFERGYRATIHANGKHHNLGRFDDPVYAAVQRDLAALKLHDKNFVRLNFPKQEMDAAA